MIKTEVVKFTSCTRYHVWFKDRPFKYIYAFRDSDKTTVSTASFGDITLKDLKRLVFALEELIDKDVFGDPSK